MPHAPWIAGGVVKVRIWGAVYEDCSHIEITTADSVDEYIVDNRVMRRLCDDAAVPAGVSPPDDLVVEGAIKFGRLFRTLPRRGFPSVDAIAGAMFAADEKVLEEVEKHSDAHNRVTGEFDQRRHDATAQHIWACNVGGHRERVRFVAGKVWNALRGASTPPEVTMLNLQWEGAE